MVVFGGPTDLLEESVGSAAELIKFINATGEFSVCLYVCMYVCMSPNVCMDVSIHVWMDPYMYGLYGCLLYVCMGVWMYVLGNACEGCMGRIPYEKS